MLMYKAKSILIRIQLIYSQQTKDQSLTFSLFLLQLTQQTVSTRLLFAEREGERVLKTIQIVLFVLYLRLSVLYPNQQAARGKFSFFFSHEKQLLPLHSPQKFLPPFQLLIPLTHNFQFERGGS